MLKIENETLRLLLPHKNEAEVEEFYAMQAMKANPALLDNAFTFEKFCYALNHTKPNFEVFEPATILHIAKAVSKIPEHNWNNEIKQYVAHVAWEEGWVKLPDILNFAQNELDALHPGNFELNEDQLKIQELKHLAVERYLR